MRLALFQPDLAGNVGTLVRLGACLGVPIDVIEPCGFPFSDKAFKRAGMDYVAQADVTGHVDWAAFLAQRRGRLVLLTTKASLPYPDAAYRPDDILLVGQESVGAPDFVHAAADLQVVIPMRPGLRSLNVAIAAAMVLGEALRQTALFPDRG
jgi:tRNA (cytidine/uridine-2'-O-)-methyltransferase